LWLRVVRLSQVNLHSSNVLELIPKFPKYKIERGSPQKLIHTREVPSCLVYTTMARDKSVKYWSNMSTMGSQPPKINIVSVARTPPRKSNVYKFKANISPVLESKLRRRQAHWHCDAPALRGRLGAGPRQKTECFITVPFHLASHSGGCTQKAVEGRGGNP